MSQAPADNDRLLDLIDAACDGTLDKATHVELDVMLREDPAARRIYLAHYRLASDVYLLEGARRAGSGAVLRLADEFDGLSAGVDHPPTETADAEAKPHHVAAKQRSWFERVLKHEFTVGVTVAAVLFAVVLVVLDWTKVPERVAKKEKAQAPVKEEFVAWLTGMHGAKWHDGTEPTRGNRLMPGRRLAIRSGMIDIVYRTGAKVVIEGPAEFYVGRGRVGGEELGELGRRPGENAASAPLDPRNAGFLAIGSLVARVDDERANGFTIDTPSARVVDYGTEFGVEYRSNSETEVVVISGAVDVVREESPGVVAETVRLTKDQGALVTSSNAPITRRAKVDASLIAAMRKRIDRVFVTTLPADAMSRLANGHFENATSTSEQDVKGFFESSDTGYADFTVEGSDKTRLSTANALNRTHTLAIGSDGYVYQQIGTYTANETVTLTGSVYRIRGHSSVNDFTVKLYVGDVTGATGSTLSTLGATELDSVTITSAGLGFTGTSPGLSLKAPLHIELRAGNRGTDGQALWLEIAYAAGSGGQTYFDNLAVSPAPEPSPDETQQEEERPTSEKTEDKQPKAAER